MRSRPSGVRPAIFPGSIFLMDGSITGCVKNMFIALVYANPMSMTTFFTKQGTVMVQHYELDETLSALQNSGLLLFPTDTLWSIGCLATDVVAVLRLLRMKAQAPGFDLEILVDSVDMLKEYVDHLHPRLETLMAYHVRPLTVVLEGPRRLPEQLLGPGRVAAFRVVRDDYCRQLIGRLGRPLAASFATLNGQAPIHFGTVSSDILQSVDHVVKYHQQEKTAGEPSVMVRLSECDELEFVRE